MNWEQTFGTRVSPEDGYAKFHDVEQEGAVFVREKFASVARGDLKIDPF